MKKLLALLGVTTLVTSASIAAVACKSTEVEVEYQNDNENEFRDLLNNFKTEIMQRFNDNYNKNVNNFSLFNEDSRLEDYQFLNLENLAKIGTNDEYILNRTEFINLLNDINLLLNTDSLINDINQLASEPEYNLLTNGLNNNIFDSFEIKNNEISLEVQDNDTSGLSVNLRFELILNFNYFKKGEIETESLNVKNLAFSIINDEKITEVVQNIINDLGKELYRSEDSPLYFTDKKLQIEDEAFKENISAETNDYVSSTVFKEPLSTAIIDIASISNMGGKMTINSSNLKSSEISWISQFAKFLWIPAENVAIESDLFKILINPDEKDFSYEERIKIIENHYSTTLKGTNFWPYLNMFLAQNDLNQNSKANYDSILGFGTFDISNIVLEVGDNEYAVPTLSLSFDYSVEDFKTEDYSSQVLNSITAFQNVYQIETSENSLFTIKNKYFWSIVDKRHSNWNTSFNEKELNAMIANYSLYQINELSFDIGKQAKFDADGFNMYFSTGGDFQNSYEGIKRVSNFSMDRLRIQLGIFTIQIFFDGDQFPFYFTK